MKLFRKSAFGILTFAVASMGLMACSDDPGYNNPDDMVVLNMKNVNNGSTTIGSTDIILDADNNFVSSDYYFFDMGPVLSLGHIEEPKELTTPAVKVAADPDEGYIAIRRDNVRRFGSGAVAELMSSEQLRFYVDSWIKESKKTVGALVNYANYTPKSYKLPNPGTVLATIDQSAGYTSSTISLDQKNCEVELGDEADDLLTCTVVSTKPMQVQVEINAYRNSVVPGRYTIYVRYGNTYTPCYVYVK